MSTSFSRIAARKARSTLTRLPARHGVPAAEVERLQEEVSDLRRALASRGVIDQARGLVMAWARCDSEQAWHILVQVSQHSNVKLRIVAHHLVGTAATGERLPDPIARALRAALREHHHR